MTTPNRAISPLSHALLLAIVLATLAYWAPWVHHPAAALRLSGQDLGEFVKFIPAIRRGERSFPRQLFYVPPLAMTVILVALSANRELPYRGWLRIATLIYAVALLPGLLPPAWGHPREMLSPEFRLQGIGFLLGAAVVAAHGLFRRQPLRCLAVLILIPALLALTAPQGAFWAIRASIWATYGASGLRLGWGLWLHVAAWLGVSVCGAVLSIQIRRDRRPPEAAL